MSEIKYYYNFWTDENNFQYKIFRDFKTLRNFWEVNNHNNNFNVLIHVGFSNVTFNVNDFPPIKKYINTSNVVLLSESARWSIPPKFSLIDSSPIFNVNIYDYEGKCDIFLVVREWGYELREEEYEIEKLICSSITEKWLSDFVSLNSKYYNAFGYANISDDNTYLNNRDKLPGEIQISADNYRFETYLSTHNNFEFKEFIGHIPVWMSYITLDNYQFTVRLFHALRRLNLKSLHDLANYHSNKLKYINSKRIEEFYEKIIQYFRDNCQDIPMAALIEEEEDIRYESNTSANGKNAEHQSIGNLLEYIENEISLLNDSDQQIIRYRMGLIDGNHKTLEEIGSYYDVTRERIRQILNKYLPRIFSDIFINKSLIPKIKNCIPSNQPLYLEMVEVYDEWFEGFSKKPKTLEFIIKNFVQNDLYVVELFNRKIITRISSVALGGVIDSINSYISENQPLAKTNVIERIETILMANNISNMFEMVSKYIFHNVLIFQNDEGEEIINGDRSIKSKVKHLLEGENKPLHYSQISEKLSFLYDQKFDIRRVHGILVTESDFIQFDRGVYGLLKHHHVDEKIAKDIANHVMSYISNQPLERQWHTSEILKLLQGKENSYDQLSIYDIDIIISQFTEYQYLGRHVWVQSYTDNLSTEDRINIHQEIVAILEKLKTPLSSDEIKCELMKIRGISNNLQIITDDILIRLSRKYLGLSYRDIPFSDKQLDEMSQSIYDFIEKNGEINHSEIDKIFSENKWKYPEYYDSYFFIGYLSDDPRFEIKQNKIINIISK